MTSPLERKDLTVHIADQAAVGVPDGAPDFTEIRGSSGRVESSPSYVEGNEVITDGQAPQQVQDRQEINFTREFDVTKETIRFFDEVVHGVQVDNTISADSTIAATGTGFTSTASFGALSVGDWFLASGFSDATLNILYKISAKADASTISTATAPPTTEAASNAITFDSMKTASGLTKTLRTIQNRTFDDAKAADTNYESFLDCFAAVGSLSVEKSGIVTGSIEFKAPNPVSGSAALSSQTDSAKDTSDIVSAINNIGAFYENGVDSACIIQTLSIEFNNNYEGDGGAAGCDDEQFGRGNIGVTGSILTRSVKATSSTWKDKNQNGTKQSIAVYFIWSDGDWAVMDITKALITSHVFTDGDIVVANEMEYAATPDTVTGASFQIFRNFV